MYWTLIIIGLIGIMLPIVTYFSIDDWCTQGHYAPDYCVEVTNENTFRPTIGMGIIMASIGGGIGMAFLIRCRYACKLKKERESNPCKSVQQTGHHNFDLTDIKLNYTREQVYSTIHHIFNSEPIKCQDCDETKIATMSTTMGQ
jgi:hypothetical protein